MRTWLGLIMLGVLLLTACNQSEGRPSVLDLNATVVSQQNERLLSATPPTATATFTPSPSPTNTPLPSSVPLTATPQVDRSRFFQTPIPASNWMTSPFTALDGQTYQLADWRGRVIVVQTLSTVCLPCQEQTQDLRAAMERLLASRNTANVVVILLSIDTFDTPDNLQAYQESFGLDAAEVTWILGTASSTLKSDLRTVFGPSVTSERSGGLFFVDKSGFGQVGLTPGSLGVTTLEQSLVHLIGGPGIDQPTEEAAP